MKKICVFLFVSVFLLVGAVGYVNATTFNLVGSNYEYNTAMVNFDYSYHAGMHENEFGRIDLSITNTSDYDPVITGFTFNAPEEVTSLLSFSGPDGWNGEYEFNGFSTPEPYGFFDVVGITGNNIQGGNPQAGIPVGETYDFVFEFDGHDLDMLSAASFLEELSYVPVQGGGSNGTAVSFLARIQQVGASGELSDVMIPGSENYHVIPEPATMLLFGAGLLFVAGAGRKKFF